MKQVVVPYTIALLNILTNGKLNLYKIWQNQEVSQELSDVIYNLMKQVNDFILAGSPVSHYIEWAKKEECWNKIKEHTWTFDENNIKSDLIDENNPPKRKVVSESDSDEEQSLEHSMDIIKSIPVTLWRKFADWGLESGCMNINQQSTARDTASRIKFNHKFTPNDIRKAISVYETICKYNIELLEEADKLAEQDVDSNLATKSSSLPTNDITLELVQRMVEWDRRKRVLEDWKWRVMDDVLKGRKPFTDKMKYAFYLNLEKLKKNGFEE